MTATPPMRCLVVSNDRLIRWSLVEFLEARGLEARSTPSNDVAVALLQEWPVDLLIAESHLPGMDGVELVTRCQNLSCRPAIILLTGGKPLLPLREMDRLGVIGVIEKPLILDPLARLLAGVAQKEKHAEGAAT